MRVKNRIVLILQIFLFGPKTQKNQKTHSRNFLYLNKHNLKIDTIITYKILGCLRITYVTKVFIHSITKSL